MVGTRQVGKLTVLSAPAGASEIPTLVSLSKPDSAEANRTATQDENMVSLTASSSKLLLIQCHVPELQAYVKEFPQTSQKSPHILMGSR